VEPVAGSTACWCRRAGYLKRLREICDRYGILLIFDEVITGFGRLGNQFRRRAAGRVAGHHDLAKGLTNAGGARWAPWR